MENVMNSFNLLVDYCKTNNYCIVKIDFYDGIATVMNLNDKYRSFIDVEYDKYTSEWK